jgi:DNA-directed RNA polymerase specialized sigma24 family protein
MPSLTMGVMAFMSRYEKRFEEIRSTGRLEVALAKWKERQDFLNVFPDSKALLSKFRSSGVEDELLKRLALLAVSTEARDGDEDAFLLLVGLYLPTFRRLRKEIGACLLEEEDLEAEMIVGFWEAVSKARGLIRNPSAVLFHGPQHRVWKAVAHAGVRRRWTDEPEDQPSSESPEDREVIRLIEEAVKSGVLSESEAALVLTTRLDQEPVAELANDSGERREALSMRRKRAEQRLAEWLAEEG